jgi:hypothetical protein
MKNTSLEIGDLVFLPKKGGNQHFGRGIVTGLSKRRVIVRPIPRHGKDERFKYKDVRLWKSKKDIRNEH